MKGHRFAFGVAWIVVLGGLASCTGVRQPTQDPPTPPAATPAETPAAAESAPDISRQADRHYDDGDFDRAATLYREALAVGFPPGHPAEENALFRLAVLLLRGDGAPREARGLLERLVASHPDGIHRAPAEALIAREREIARLRGQIEALKRIDLQDGNR